MAKYEELATIISGLRDYLSKDLAGMAVHDEPDSIRGEDSKKVTLAADWVKKLDPISGGKGGEKEVPPAAKSKAAVSGTDPYLHKEMGDTNMPTYKAEDEKLHEEGAKDMLEDETADVVDEDVEDDLGDDDNMVKSAEIVGLLQDIKGLLEQSYMSKQTLGEVSLLKDAVSNLQKSMPTMLEKEVKKGLKTSLRSFGMMAASNSGDVMKRNIPVPSTPIKLAEKVDANAEKRIGLDGDFSKGVDPFEEHNQFVSNVETILGTTEIDDLKGSFRRLNKMRENSGQSFQSNHWYFPTR